MGVPLRSAVHAYSLAKVIECSFWKSLGPPPIANSTARRSRPIPPHKFSDFAHLAHRLVRFDQMKRHFADQGAAAIFDGAPQTDLV
jgi:hypothetical protein